MNDLNENKNVKKSKFDFKLLANIGVSAVAIVLSIVALAKGGPIGPVGSTGATGQAGVNGANAYELACQNGYTGTLSEWLESLNGIDGTNGQPGADGQPGAAGKDGSDGKDGKDGLTPRIGDNGNWWIGETDTEVPAIGAKGADGKDGAAGKDGSDGSAGVDGEDGLTPRIGDNGNWWIGETDTEVPAAGAKGADGKDGSDGKDGKDAVDSLSSMDEYFALLDATKPFSTYSFFDNINDDYTRCGLANFDDAIEIYNTVEPAIYTFRAEAHSLPLENGYVEMNFGTTEDPQMIYYNKYTEQSSTSVATFEISRTGNDENAYISVNFTSRRHVISNCYCSYLEAYNWTESDYPVGSDPDLEDYEFYVDDFGEFTKIGEKYYLIYCSPSFSESHYVIQEFSEEVYKMVVSSFIYSIINLPYFEGKDYYLQKDGTDIYQKDFIGSKTDNSAKGQYSNNYVSECTYKNGKLVSLNTLFDDSLGVTITNDDFNLVNYVKQSASVVYGNSNHQYYEELPTDHNWAEASLYWYHFSGLDDKEVLNDLTADKEIYSSLIYQMFDIFRNSYIGVSLTVS